MEACSTGPNEGSTDGIAEGFVDIMFVVAVGASVIVGGIGVASGRCVVGFTVGMKVVTGGATPSGRRVLVLGIGVGFGVGRRVFGLRVGLTVGLVCGRLVGFRVGLGDIVGGNVEEESSELIEDEEVVVDDLPVLDLELLVDLVDLAEEDELLLLLLPDESHELPCECLSSSFEE